MVSGNTQLELLAGAVSMDNTSNHGQGAVSMGEGYITYISKTLE